jgi:hypothetical protein
MRLLRIIRECPAMLRADGENENEKTPQNQRGFARDEKC